MTKIELINNLKNLYQQNSLFNSIIINVNDEQSVSEITNETTRFIFCENNSWENDDCSLCKKAIKQTLMDVVMIGDGATSITKEQLKKVLDQMSLSAFEINGNKIYVIKNIENLKPDAANSILKFLEEPPKKTYAFLITKDRSLILPTIKSRSKTFVVEQIHELKNENLFSKIILSNNTNTYLLAGNDFKQVDKKDLILMVENALTTLIIKTYPNWAKLTIELIDDLKYSINWKLALEHYFIQLAKDLK